MSGHNKWAQIKRKKAVTDAARSKVFSKFARAISSELRAVGGRSDAPSVKAIIERAQKENMPKDAIERAVAKGTGENGAQLETVLFETFGPGGVALLITAVTDSRNRTVAEIKHILSKQGYELCAMGSAVWAFTKENREYIPSMLTPVSEEDGEKLNVLIEAIEDQDDVEDVYTNAE
jgi:YebC/PmpR family DNA-binding regulatory protein